MNSTDDPSLRRLPGQLELPGLDHHLSVPRQPRHTAPYALGGFLYQIRYAALQALKLTVGQTLGIECIDDVDISDPAWKQLIQVKNEQSKPLTDMNIGLWKTLAYWAKECQLKSIEEIENYQFLFITNATINGKFPLMLTTKVKRVEDLDEIVKYIKTEVNDSANKKLAGFIEMIKKYDESKLRKILERTRIEREGDADGLQSLINAQLRSKTFRDSDLAQVARQFEGWIIEQVLSALELGRGARILEQEICELMQNLRDQQRAMDIQFLHQKTNISPQEFDSYRNRLFAKQLCDIELNRQVVDKALYDYLRNEKERAEWAQSLQVGKPALESFDAEIFDRWQDEFIDPSGARAQLDNKQSGRALYDRVTNSISPRIGNTDPPKYVYKGTLHRLADEPRIGWHPQWKELYTDKEDNQPRREDSNE